MRLIFIIPIYVILIMSNPLHLESTELVPSIAKVGLGGSAFDHAIYIFMNIHERLHIRTVLLGVSGIYCWFNTINGNCYVGRGVNLYRRVSNYYTQYHINHNKKSSLICRAILKHSINAFVLIILDVNPINLALAEQK